MSVSVKIVHGGTREGSIVGYDDDRLARLSHINLTTVAQDAPRLARLAVETAIASLDGAQAADTELVIPPHLVVRGTTARARPGGPGPACLGLRAPR